MNYLIISLIILPVFIIGIGTFGSVIADNPCDAFEKAQDKGHGKKIGLEKAKANNDCPKTTVIELNENIGTKNNFDVRKN